jgi:PAS domain S-box-containing protein
MADIPFILIAEDEPAHAEAICRALGSAGAKAELPQVEVQVVGSLWEYRQAVAARPPDLALVDMKLPDGRALEVLTAPADDGAFPVVVMTSYGNEQLAVEAMKAGALDYIPKSPEAFANMPHTVRRALGQWEQLLRSKWTEAELQESEEQFRLLFSTSMDAVLLTMPDGQILAANAAACRMFQRSEDDLRRVGRGGVVDASDLRLQAGLMERARTGNFHGELTLIRGDGSKFTAELSSAVFRNHEGVERTSMVIRDVTERKQAEAALAEETARRRILFEQSPDGIVILDPQTGRFLEFNAAAHEHLGYAREEFAGLRLSDLDTVETPEEIKARIAAVLRTGRSDFETLHRTKQGGVRSVLVTAQTMDVMGRSVYYCVWRDITEFKELERKFLRAQKMEAIGMLAGGVAHDFRNQLTVIRGYGEMLLRRDLVKAGAKEYVEHILQAADRSATISGQLLAFSRQQTLRPAIANLNALTCDMMKSLTNTLGEDVRLSVMPRGEVWNTLVDTGQFQQALLNLVLNARDAMPQGGQLTIETEDVVLDASSACRHVGAAAGQYVLVTISDTGAGMSPGTLDHIFEPFFTTKPAGEGTGLGLAMVHGFVTQSGGFIEVDSRCGQGTTFRLYFPALPGAAAPAEPASPAAELPRGSGTILVVEDEGAIRRVLLDTLGECGYTVLTAGNALEAMGLVKSSKRRIDLLITDVVMPGQSGPDLAKRVREFSPGLPVLMISGHTGRKLTAHGVVPADANLLAKPFSAQTLAQTVRDILAPPRRP